MDGDKNIPDALTKAVDGNKIQEHVRKMGGGFAKGRQRLAPALNEDEDAAGEAGQGEGEDDEEVR